MLALLSPAKKQDFSTPPKHLVHGQPYFLSDTKILAKAVYAYGQESLMKLMKISPKLAELNVRRFQTFADEHTPENAKQAALAFQGDTYVGLDAPSLSEEDWAFSQHHLAIVSGLYGLLRPLDLIQAHRLEMGTKLTTQRGTNLYEFWGDQIANRINGLQNNDLDPWIINLASAEYFKAVPPKCLRGTVLTPVFKESQGDKLRVIGILAKRARGRMARYMVQNRLTHVDGLKKFTVDGYRFRPELSTDHQWIFVR